MDVRLVVDFLLVAGVIVVMHRAGQELRLLPKPRVRRCASCGRQLPSRCRCRETG